MNINFDRNSAQVMYEGFIGATAEDIVNKKEEFKNHILVKSEVVQLNNALKEDSLNFFYNGVLSLAEGIDSAFSKRFSWATVKLYYSLYYLIRSSMATKGVAMLRCKSMYRLIVREGEKPFGTGNRKYNTTHEGTISHYKDMFATSDMLLSNNIEDEDVYQWMMNVREIVNYRSSSFAEPNCFEIWDYFLQSINNGTFVDALEQLENDPYVMCFQEEYAVLAVPIKRLQQTIYDLLNKGWLSEFTQERNEYVKNVLKYDERKLSVIRELFA